MKEPLRETWDLPTTTVVIPTVGRAGALRRCLEALGRQDHPRFEVVVIDDASADETPDVLREMAASTPKLCLRWLRHAVRLGANPSRNRGVAEARGEVVAFVDDDCVPNSTWLSALVAGFRNPEVGAVTGLVDDAPCSNVFELALKGNHRVIVRGAARRLAGTNMAVRRDLLLALGWDEDRQGPPAGGAADSAVSARGDEEGLHLMIQALGYDVAAAPRARVLHEHRHTARSFFRQALRGGRSAARLVYKYRLPPRTDMLPFLGAWLSLPLVLIDLRWGVVPAAFLLLALAAITFNDLVLKAKTPGETLLSFPVLVAWYHLRLLGYALETVRLHAGGGGAIRRVDLEALRRHHPLARPRA